VTAQTGPSPKCSSGRRMLRTNAQSIAYFGDPFRPLEPECKVVQFEQSLTTDCFSIAYVYITGLGGYNVAQMTFASDGRSERVRQRIGMR